MTCMTTKQKFEVSNPPVVVLANGRYAFRVQCPWQGKDGRDLYAFKFCSKLAYEKYNQFNDSDDETVEENVEENVDPNVDKEATETESTDIS